MRMPRQLPALRIHYPTSILQGSLRRSPLVVMVLEEIQQFRLPRDCRSTLSGVNSYAQWTKGLSCAAESRRRCEARPSGNRRSFQCLHCPVVLRIVRCPPQCASLPGPDGSEGWALDNPQGRKPRRDTASVSWCAGLWGFEDQPAVVRRGLWREPERPALKAWQARGSVERAEGAAAWPRGGFAERGDGRSRRHDLGRCRRRSRVG